MVRRRNLQRLLRKFIACVSSGVQIKHCLWGASLGNFARKLANADEKLSLLSFRKGEVRIFSQNPIIRPFQGTRHSSAKFSPSERSFSPLLSPAENINILPVWSIDCILIRFFFCNLSIDCKCRRSKAIVWHLRRPDP